MSSSELSLRLATEPVVCATLEQIARQGARRALQKAIEDEVADYVNAHRDQVDASGRRLVVRNGHKPVRAILSGLGPIQVEPPRVNDRRTDENGVRFRFTSKILPPYLRKTKAVEDLVPWLYLKGISTGEMGDALVHLGFDGSGLSATSVTRMLESWQGQYRDWSKRSLAGKRYVYLWADGIYFGCRLTDDRPCVLVLMGATADGAKELVAMADGQRESEASWLALLLDAKDRGLANPPKLATGDGSLGFWLALAKVFPSTRQQRCWVHGSTELAEVKTANVLDKLAQGPAAGGQGDAARGLDGRDQRRCDQSLRPLRRRLRHEVAEGRGLPGKRSCRTAGVLRLPRRALAAPAHQQPDRKHLRHGAPADLPHQGPRLASRGTGDGVQAHPEGSEALAKAERQREATRPDRRHRVRGR
jgi:transposase-like protein